MNNYKSLRILIGDEIMSKKLRGIGVQLVGFFVLAILIPTLILAFRAIETTKSAQTENLKLTSVQTLQETKMGFTNYLKNISQPIDLLTRNDADRRAHV